VGIAEGVAGVLAAAGSAVSLIVRIIVGHRADRRRDYGFSTMVILLLAGAVGFALLAVGSPAPFVLGAFVAFGLGWGWPGLFNLAVVDLNRDSPGAATGISQTGIYVGAAFGPAAYGLLSSRIGYSAAWLVAGGFALVAAMFTYYAARYP
jgi:predicted MFS family arabinose efflux permease